MKNVVKYYQDFFGYLNALKTHGVNIMTYAIFSPTKHKVISAVATAAAAAATGANYHEVPKLWWYV